MSKEEMLDAAENILKLIKMASDARLKSYLKKRLDVLEQQYEQVANQGE